MHGTLNTMLKMGKAFGGSLISVQHRVTLTINTLNHTRLAYLYSFSLLDKCQSVTVFQTPPNHPSRRYSRDNKDTAPQDIIITKVFNQKGKNGRRKLEDTFLFKKKKLQREIEHVLEERRLLLRNARKKMQERGKVIIQDIKQTKNKMKEKIEGVIEKENVYTIPNFICIARIGLSPLLGYLIITHNFESALIFMIVAGVSDWIDGWVARNYKNQCSKIGSFLDPMADKVLIGTLFLSLSYVYLIPVALTTLVIFRDIILIISGFVIRYHSLPPPRTLSRYFDVTHATAQLAPTFISKVNTGIQLVLVGSTLAAPVFGYVDHSFLHIMWYITAASTVAAAGSYIFSKQTYKYLKKKNIKRKI